MRFKNSKKGKVVLLSLFRPKAVIKILLQKGGFYIMKLFWALLLKFYYQNISSDRVAWQAIVSAAV